MGTYTFTKNLKGVSIALLLLPIVGIIPFTKLQADPKRINYIITQGRRIILWFRDLKLKEVLNCSITA